MCTAPQAPAETHAAAAVGSSSATSALHASGSGEAAGERALLTDMAVLAQAPTLGLQLYTLGHVLKEVRAPRPILPILAYACYLLLFFGAATDAVDTASWRRQPMPAALLS